MRTRLTGGLAAAVLLTGTLAVAVPAAADPGGVPSDRGRATEVTAGRADRAMGRDTHVPTPAEAHRADATQRLTEAFAAYVDLRPAERRATDSPVARPTNPTANDYADYEGVRPDHSCDSHVCVHYIDALGDDDAVPGADDDDKTVPDWVQTNLEVLEAVWAFEVDGKGYRAPASDGTKGGNRKFDVYLAQLGNQGLYGYCAPERRVRNQPRRASGYCVLDNDFAEFVARTPLENLKVTAAHEFFHAIQFNYDVFEDSWVKEATATWMEERFADAINDNRQFLSAGQLRRPGKPLDTFDGTGAQYGNWILFERLSQDYGVKAVRAIWSRLDGTRGKTNDFSVEAVAKYLAAHKTSLRAYYARFGAGNLFPSVTYSEGEHYTGAKLAKGWSFSGGGTLVPWQKTTLKHLTNRSFGFVHAAGLRGQRRLRITVDLPARVTGSAAYVIVVPDTGRLVRKAVRTDRQGRGTITVPFSPKDVNGVTLTLASGSARYVCGRSTVWSCEGRPVDNNLTFRFTARMIR